MALALDRFSQRLAESGLLSDAEVASLIETLPADRRPQDGEQLARLLVKQKKLTVYQAQQIYAGKGRSLVLGNYVVLDKLGQGGMGTVLKAEHRRMERIVAIKVLSPAVVKNPGSLLRFQREVKMAARLEHPNIVTAYDADEASGVHFLVMQYVDGCDLTNLVNQHGPLPLDQAVSCVVQAARGLEYAHRQAVIHRDVKPSNLLLDHEGVVKVLDMGLARVDVATEQDQLTLSGQIMGTVDYMAPEQALDTRAADARADIYSLGATLWFLLTGRVMYQAETIMQKLRAHECAPIPALAEHCPGVTPELETIYRTMVAKQPHQRYQTMGEVVSLLENCLASLPPTSRSAQGGHSQHRPSPSQASLNLASASASGAQSATRSYQSQVQVQPRTIYPPSEVDTDPNTRDALTNPNIVAQGGAPRVPAWRNRRRDIFLGLSGSVAVLLAVLVFYLPSQHGTIRVEISDPQIEASIKGTDIVFSQAGGAQDLTLSPGNKTLVVKRGDFVFETNDFTLRKGENVAVRVQLLDGQVIVRQGATLLGAEKLPATDVPAERQVPQLAIAPFNATQAKEHQQAWSQYLGIPVKHTIKLAEGVELPLVLIPPGEFLMGSTEDQIQAAVTMAAHSMPPPNLIDSLRAEQTPQHRVKLTRPFLIGATEVTIGHFKAFTKATGYVTRAEEMRAEADANPARHGKRPLWSFRTFLVPGYPVTDDYPAAQVNWDDAQAFCRWLNSQPLTKLGEDMTLAFRLPTEAEWEFACRAGTQSLFSFGDEPRLLEQFGWHSVGAARRVAALRPNAFGLYDMHGNLSEWCSDWFGLKWYEISPAIDPVGPEAGTMRVLRGGSALQSGQYRDLCAARQAQPQGWSSGISSLGFRIVATIRPRSASDPAQQPSQRVDPKLLSSPEQQQAFIDHVAKLPAEQQAKAVTEKLKEVNPGFDGARTYKVADGKLVEYGVSTVNITELWPLKALVDLKALDIRGSLSIGQPGRIQSLEPLAGLKLESLSCFNNPRLRDFAPLAGMPLTKLNLAQTAIDDLSQLKGMQLQELFIFGTYVDDVSPLAGMPLTRLECGYTKVSDLRPLQQLPLTELVLMWTPVSDLSPLRGLKLNRLNLNACKNIKDISILADMPLSNLVISGTSVSDLSPLQGLQLTYFHCDDTPISDLSPLKGMPLQVLAIKGTAVTDLSPVKEARLNSLVFDVVPERDEAILRAMKHLQYINRMPTEQFWQAIKAPKTP